MIKFASFINAIHNAILSANDALAEKNLEIIEKFFEEPDGRDGLQSSEFQGTLGKALTAIDEVLGQKTRAKEQRLTKLLEVLKGVRETLSEGTVIDADSNQEKIADGLRPKMTTILYPQQTANGVVMSNVKVPLITLVPLSMTQISQVKVNTSLQIHLKGEDLLVSFPAIPPRQLDDKDDDKLQSPLPFFTTLEVTLTPHHGTEGLKKLVEGYEKVLRSQIP